jgi:hypothetical protein
VVTVRAQSGDDRLADARTASGHDGVLHVLAPPVGTRGGRFRD